VMARLLLVEIRRVLSRGVTRTLTLLGVAVIVLVGVLVFRFAPQKPEIQARAQSVYNQRVASCVAMGQSRNAPRPGPGDERGAPADPAGIRARCEQLYTGQLEHDSSIVFRLGMAWPDTVPAIPAGVADNPFLDLGFLLQGLLILPCLMLIVGAVAGGASMSGAEWQAGSFVTLLTWEPRRGRLLGARIAASAIVGFAIAVALLSLFIGALAPTAWLHGTIVETRHWWLTLGITILEMSGLVALAAAVGAALGMIGKRTVFAVFALVGYLVAGELVLRLYWEGSHRWLLLHNLALALGADAWFTDTSTAQGIAVLVGASAVIIAAALVAFTRRDFTSSG
jgi:hypothetical protein